VGRGRRDELPGYRPGVVALHRLVLHRGHVLEPRRRDVPVDRLLSLAPAAGRARRPGTVAVARPGAFLVAGTRPALPVLVLRARTSLRSVYEINSDQNTLLRLFKAIQKESKLQQHGL
jgi:hypothetical protein